MADIRITPASSVMAFTSSLGFKETFTQEVSGSITLYGSGSTGRTDIFSVDGNNGRLFSVSDDLSNSLFSVNTIAGLPVIEAFADNTVNIGKYGAYSFQALGNGNAGIGSGSVMFVSASGNVGIGTQNPPSILSLYRGSGVNAYLEVAGNGNTPGTTSMLYGQDSSNNGYVWNRSNSAIYFGTNNSIKMFLNSSGDFLIGTTTSVYSSGGRGLIQINGSSNALLSLTVGEVDTGYLYHTGTNMQLWNSKPGTLVFGTNNIQRMTITSAGDIGIGTTSPSKKLDL